MKRLFLIGFVFSVAAAAQPHDVAGWGRTKWGMPEGTVRALFPKARKIDEEGRRGLELQGFTVSKLTCDVFMGFDEKKGLSLVGIHMTEVGEKTFSKLEQDLREKYGAPTAAMGAAPDPAHSLTWSFTSTKISLIFFGGRVLLKYEPLSASNPNL